MRKLFTTLGISLLTITSFGQVGAVMSDFTQTDLNGTVHNLYDYLEEGKVVIVDMSTTWCGPCWNFHQAHYLKDLYEEFGPDGTDEVVILFYEDDLSTTLDDLNGTGSSTMGDWVTDVPYPIINATQSLPSEYGTGYPTVSVICPTDKVFKYNLNQSNGLAEMKTQVQEVITDCGFTASIDEIKQIEYSFSPNPTSDFVKISFNSLINEASTVNLYNLSGQLVKSFSIAIKSGKNSIQLDLSDIDLGTYVLKFESNSGSNEAGLIVKQ
jgi:thiol-disulfide isomerase/thioredoxin